ncbi:MAG: DUF1295 domain-containing protein [Phenylobacterium sp.]|uniref:DUF1295 domain-containing protein n=1 Tax=Phenylobacterium sp. TaxID=1871053 RepID=UPI00391A6898
MTGLILAAFMVLAMLACVMAAAWAVQAATRNGGWLDVFWTFGVGAVAAALAFAPLEALPAPLERRLAFAVLIALWSLRLGTYLFRRTAGAPEDARYAAIRRNAGPRPQGALFGAAMAQAPAGALLVIPVGLAAHAPGPLGWTDLAAALTLAAAIVGAGVADAQLAGFKADPRNRGKVCDRGLWRLSRHPNYVFEWLGWCAFPVAALGHGPASPWFWASLTAPALMYLLLRHVSGVPPLERSMLASRGEAYRTYQARTPIFFPIPMKRHSR